MSLEYVWLAVQAHWGDAASVVGLGVSVATLVVARGARAAAEAAKTEARRQNLVDEIQDAQKKAEQLGTYLSQQKWEIVQLRSQEVITSCSQILRRWGADSLSQTSHNNLLRVQQQVGSIAKVAIRSLRNPPSDIEFELMSIAHNKAFNILSIEAAELAGIIDKRR
ncbi:MAG: hypothetical protein ACYC92_06755 [Candidatus Acidiferrales bacterium]